MRNFLIVLTTTTMLFTGCFLANEAAIPESGWRVSLGSRGGVTGGGGVVIVYTDGSVEVEKYGPNGQLEIEQIGKADIELVKEVGEAMNTKNLIELDHKEFANMTTSLTWHYDGKSRTYAWETGTNNLPTPIQSAVDAFKQTVDSVQQDLSD